MNHFIAPGPLLSYFENVDHNEVSPPAQGQSERQGRQSEPKERHGRIVTPRDAEALYLGRAG